ncbi:hypothetical protein [Thalassotalea sp. G20_0]
MQHALFPGAVDTTGSSTTERITSLLQVTDAS